MPSFAGLYNPQIRLRLALAAIAGAALAGALLLAFVSAIVPHTIVQVQHAATNITIPPLPHPFTSIVSATGAHEEPASLWTLLAPWALGIDLVAIAGFVAVVWMWRK